MVTSPYDGEEVGTDGRKELGYLSVESGAAVFVYETQSEPGHVGNRYLWYVYAAKLVSGELVQGWLPLTPGFIVPYVVIDDGDDTAIVADGADGVESVFDVDWSAVADTTMTIGDQSWQRLRLRCAHGLRLIPAFHCLRPLPATVFDGLRPLPAFHCFLGRCGSRRLRSLTAPEFPRSSIALLAWERVGAPTCAEQSGRGKRFV